MILNGVAWAKAVTSLAEPVYGHHCYCLCPVHLPVTGGICAGTPLVSAVEFTLKPVLVCRPCGDWWRDHRTVIDGEVVAQRGELPAAE